MAITKEQLQGGCKHGLSDDAELVMKSSVDNLETGMTTHIRMYWCKAHRTYFTVVRHELSD